MLPKIHKPKRPPPGRPIVSANGCATEKISALVDIILRLIVPKTRSYLKDTGHFLQKLANYHAVITPNTLLVSSDVSALYTNIPNEEGRRAVARWLTKYRPAALIREGEPSNKTVLTLLKMVLELNNFDFNREHFLQVGGTSVSRSWTRWLKYTMEYSLLISITKTQMRTTICTTAPHTPPTAKGESPSSSSYVSDAFAQGKKTSSGMPWLWAPTS